MLFIIVVSIVIHLFMWYWRISFTVNWQEGSDSERESNDGPRTSHKPQKRGRGKFWLMSKGTTEGRYLDLLQYQPSPSGYGCLSLSKRKHSGGNYQAFNTTTVLQNCCYYSFYFSSYHYAYKFSKAFRPLLQVFCSILTISWYFI